MPLFTINFCSRISLFSVFFFTLFYSLSSLTLGGPALCLNEGVVPLLLVISACFRLSNFSLFFIGSCFILLES